MNDRFAFLKTYADSLVELEKADKDMARELAWKIIQYWIYNNDYDSENPIVEAMFVQIKVMLDRWQDITEKRRNANKQRTNINKKEQKGTNEEQKRTKEEQNEIKDKKENIKEKKENKEDNNSLKAIDKSYGNEEVNLCIGLIKKFNNGIVNWAETKQRQYAWNLITKLKKLDNVSNWKYTRNEVLESMLMLCSNDKYYASKTTSPELIYYNIWPLLKRCNELWEKNQGTTTLQLI